MRPHLFVTAKEIKGLRSVAAVRTAVKTGRAQTIWEELKRAADADAEADVLVPTSIVPGRPAAQAKAANPDWSVCHLTGQRLLRAVGDHLSHPARGADGRVGSAERARTARPCRDN